MSSNPLPHGPRSIVPSLPLSSGWRKGRILKTRLILAACAAAVLVTGRGMEHPWMSRLMEGLGLLLVAFGIWGRLWSTLYIGGRKDTLLVTSGPYAHSRNPLYFYSALAALGVAAASGMVSVMIIVIIGFYFVYSRVIRAEERKLLARHGRDFMRYCAEVPRFWPDWRPSRVADASAHDPDRLEAFSPLLFRRVSKDTAWFLVAWVAVRSLSRLQELGVLPVWWELL